MRTVDLPLTAMLLLAATAGVVTEQRSTAPATATAPRLAFTVVSVRRNMTNDVGSNIMDRADGGFTMLNVPVSALIARAYSPAVPLDMVGLPRWATTDRYDVSTTSSIANPTADQRRDMLRTLLADRFKLVAHTDRREQAAYDLVMARADRRLGPGITSAPVDCEEKAATTAPSRCRLVEGSNKVEGDTTMVRLASFLRTVAGRPVVDKTGLKGSYHVTITYDRAAPPPGSGAAPPAFSAVPSIFTAVQEQLGMKLEPSRAFEELLVIDRLERPSEN